MLERVHDCHPVLAVEQRQSLGKGVGGLGREVVVHGDAGEPPVLPEENPVARLATGPLGNAASGVMSRGSPAAPRSASAQAPTAADPG